LPDVFGYKTVEQNNPHPPSTNGAKTVSHQNRSFSDHATRNNRDYIKVDTNNEGGEGSEDDFQQLTLEWRRLASFTTSAAAQI
jgi:hypothetical protein